MVDDTREREREHSNGSSEWEGIKVSLSDENTRFIVATYYCGKRRLDIAGIESPVSLGVASIKIFYFRGG